MRGLRGGGVVALLGGLLLAVTAGRPTLGAERPQAAPEAKVQVVAPGGTRGVEPEPGVPPAPTAAEGRERVRASVDAPRRLVREAAEASMRALSLTAGEATIEVEGRREVVRAGSRVGNDVVKSVIPGRIVLERPARPGEAGGSALVIVTFDDEGRGRTSVFWAADPVAGTKEAEQP